MGIPGIWTLRRSAPMLEACSGAKLVLPKSAADPAHAAGIPYDRMTTTDAGLRIEYFKDNLYGRMYAVPSAHPQLDWTAIGRLSVSGLPDPLRALDHLSRGRLRALPGSGRAPAAVQRERRAAAHRRREFFSVSEAAQLAEDIGAKWLVPMHYGSSAKTWRAISSRTCWATGRSSSSKCSSAAKNGRCRKSKATRPRRLRYSAALPLCRMPPISAGNADAGRASVRPTVSRRVCTRWRWINWCQKRFERLYRYDMAR